MATAESVKDKLSGLIQKANQTTGKNDADLTAAIGSLIAGFGQGDSGGLAYDMGEFVFDTDTLTSLQVTIPHNLGTAPEFICVWTDHWAGLTSDSTVGYSDLKQTAVGFIWLKDITGMMFRASSAVTGASLCVGLHINRDDYRLATMFPSSNAYGIPAAEYKRITENVFCLANFGVNGPMYRAGVTYKYFVSRAWWNVGGVASAE